MANPVRRGLFNAHLLCDGEDRIRSHRARRCAIVGGLFLIGAGALSIQQPAAARPPVEYELLDLINGGRSAPVIMHSGLQIAAREHSEEMARAGELSHAGGTQRIDNASPDPPEDNGSPDDGYTGRVCENVAYVSGQSQDGVAKRIYEGWRKSSNHVHCMTSPEMNAGGVGLYFDGSGWWATLNLIVDRTPPGQRTALESVVRAPPPSVKPTVLRRVARHHHLTSSEPAAAPLAQGTPTPPRAPTAPPHVQAQSIAAGEVEPASGRNGIGWSELLAGMGVAGISALAARRRSPWSGRST